MNRNTIAKQVSNIAILLIALIISMPMIHAVELKLIYDANGNLVSGDGKYRYYNSLNQLTKIYNGSDGSGLLLEEYTYHPTEERVLVKKVYNSDASLKETVYYIDQNFVRVVNSSGTFDTTYIYHEGQLIAQKNPDGSKYFIHGNNEGSSSVITNSSGQVIENTSYSPSGEILSGGSSTRYSHENKEFDSNVGDYDFNFRKYKPEWMLFLQPDSLIQNTFDPQSLNRYMFERGNPVKNIDKNGHCLEDGCVAEAALIGGLFNLGAYLITNDNPTWSGAGESFAGGAIAGGAIAYGVAAALVGGAIGSALDKVANNDKISTTGDFIDIGVDAFLNAATAGVVDSLPPHPKDWLLKHPMSYLTTKTGLQFILKETVGNTFSYLLSSAYRSLSRNTQNQADSALIHVSTNNGGSSDPLPKPQKYAASSSRYGSDRKGNEVKPGITKGTWL